MRRKIEKQVSGSKKYATKVRQAESSEKIRGESRGEGQLEENKSISVT